MHLGGYKFGGHTELLQKHSGAKSSRLCLASPSSGLVVVHATCHIPFKDVAARIGDPGRILETVRLTRLFCRQMGFRAHGDEPKARTRRSLSLRTHTLPRLSRETNHRRSRRNTVVSGTGDLFGTGNLPEPRMDRI